MTENKKPHIIELLETIEAGERELGDKIREVFGQGYPHDHFAKRVIELIRAARLAGRTSIELTFKDTEYGADAPYRYHAPRALQFEYLNFEVTYRRESLEERPPAPGDFGQFEDVPYVPPPARHLDVVILTVSWA